MGGLHIYSWEFIIGGNFVFQSWLSLTAKNSSNTLLYYKMQPKTASPNSHGLMYSGGLVIGRIIAYEILYRGEGLW